MRYALPPTPDGYTRFGFTCQCCGRLIVTGVDGLFDNPPRGTDQRFCGSSCRQAAYRRRRAGATETTRRQLIGGRRRQLNPDPDTDNGGAKTNRQGGANSG